MPSKRPRNPKYRHYKPKDLAVVRIDGKDQYLGKYGSPESHEKYRRLLAEWLRSKTVSALRGERAAGNSSPLGSCVSVNELILAFWTHTKSYYVKNGRPTDEQAGIRSALRFLRQLYGHTAVAGLRKGRTKAREIPPVPPVPDGHVEAALPHLSEVVRAMVRFQRLTGWRPEVDCQPIEAQPRYWVRRKYGIEAAQVALGHAHADVTQVYAEKNLELAKRIAGEMG